MFDFGSPLDTAKLSWEYALSAAGPEIPFAPYDELEEQDLRNVLAYLHIAIGDALHNGLSDEVVEILVNEYDGVFQLLAEGCDSFREMVRANKHFPATGNTSENVQKYKQLAGL